MPIARRDLFRATAATIITQTSSRRDDRRRRQGRITKSDPGHGDGRAGDERDAAPHCRRENKRVRRRPRRRGGHGRHRLEQTIGRLLAPRLF